MRTFQERSVGQTPVILTVDKVMLIDAINLARKAEALQPIPYTAEVTTRIPRGGDYSGEDLGIARDQCIDIRWSLDQP